MPGTVLFAGATETATITVSFTVNGVPADPGTVTITVTDPLGASTVYTSPTVTKSSTGNYAVNVATPTAGEWSYTWAGTTPVPDVQHGSFSVQETSLGHLYATPQQLRSRLGLASSDTSFDLELQQACYAASRSIEQYCRRVFWRGPAGEVRLFEPETHRPMALSAWTFDPYYAWEIELGPFNDLVSLASLSSDLDGDGVFETTWTTGSYELNPVNTAGPEPRPYERVRAIGQALPWFWSAAPWPTRLSRLQVTGVFGWPQVPAAIAESTRVLAAQLFRMRDAPLGVASFGDLGVARVTANPVVAQLAGPYRLGGGLGAFA